MKKLNWLWLLTLTACSTPTIELKHDKTGVVVKCGGAIGSDYVYAVGPLGSYFIERNKDKTCVEKYIADGYKPIEEQSAQ